MIAPSSLAQTIAPQPSAFQADQAPSPATDLLPATAVRDFAFNINTALIAALVAQGQDVSSVSMQRRLRAYAEPQIAAPAKLRRYA